MKDYFLALFLASALFFGIWYVPAEFFLPAVAAGTLVLALVALKVYGNRVALAFLLLSLLYVLVFGLENSNTLYMQMGMGFFSLYLLWGERAKIWARGHYPGRVLQGVALFLFMVFIGIAVNLAASLLGLNDAGNAVEVVQELPLYLLVFAFTLVPVTEELFFRGVLVPAFGKWTTPFAGAAIASLFFGITHAAYGSVIEILGASILGLVLALYFLRKGDLLPCMVAHALFNFSSIFIIKAFVG